MTDLNRQSHRALPLVAKAAGLTFAVAAIAGLIVLAIGLARTSTSGDVSAAASSAPKFDVTVTNSAPEAPSDLIFELDLPSGDVNFAVVVGFVPGDWDIVHGDDIPVGAEVGTVRADVTVGLIGSPCNQVLPVEFKMRNGSLDQEDSFAFDDDIGGGRDGDGNPIANNVDDWAEDLDENGLIEAIDHWPEFIFRTLEDTEEEPIRRAAGMIILASTPVLLQFLTFPPGTFINDSIPNDPALGYPTVVLLQDFGDPQIKPAPGVITDFCTPLASVATFFGVTKDNANTADVDEGGVPLLVNPMTDGSYTFTLASTGQRDADGDGYENSLDTCPLVPNVGNPRFNNDGDLDFDGLDAICDPNDDPSEGGTNSDQDADGYLNRQDNCPLVGNGENTTNQADADEDGIGDVCDPNPGNADPEGELPFSQKSVDVVIGMVKGNIDCDEDIDAVDALKELQHVAGLPVSQEPGCPAVGSEVASLFGDVDCDDNITSVDALFILRFVADLPVSLPQDCPPIGA